MDNDAVKQVQDRLAELPPDVRSAIQSADLDKKVQTVGAKNNLHIDQIGELGDEVMLVMLGFTPLETFDKRLVQALGLTSEIAQKVAADVGADIFAPIRESMKQWAQKKNAPAPVQDAKPAAVQPAAPALPKNPALAPADMMLSQKTTSPTAAPAAKPEQNPIYKADPYREPV